MGLNHQILEYHGEPISLKDEGYEAPFKPSSQGKRNLKKVDTIYLTTMESSASNLNSQVSDGKYPLRREDTFKPLP